MARVKVKASPTRARTSVPGDVADTMKWVKISFGGSTSRYVVHYHLDNGTGEDLKPICGSKNVNNRAYEPRIGEHVNCTKCITKKGAMRMAAANAAMAEARVAQQVKDIEKATENVANAKPRSAPPVPPLAIPPAPVLPPLIMPPAAVPAQRNGYGPSLFQAPAYPAAPPADVDDYDDEDEEDYDDDIDSADEEAPQMTTPTVTPLTAFPARPTTAPSTPAAVAAPKPVAPVATPPEPTAAPEPPVKDDVIVVRSNIYDVTLTHPVTKVKMVIEGVQADSEDEAELFALDYVEVEVETVTRTTRVRAPRK